MIEGIGGWLNSAPVRKLNWRKRSLRKKKTGAV